MSANHDETKAELVRKIVRLEAENSRLRSEVYRSRTPWYKRIFRKPYSIGALEVKP